MKGKILTLIQKFVLITLFVILSCGSQPNIQQRSDSDVPAFLFYKRALDEMVDHNYPQALASLDTAIILKPEFSQFYYARGQILELMDQERRAITAYEMALKFKSHYPDVWKKLAKLYLEQRQYDKSVQMLRQLTSYQADSLQFELMLADAYLGAGKPLLALERIAYYEKQGARSPETERIRGSAYFLLDEAQTAIRYLQLYTQANPNNYISNKYLGICFISTGDWENGIRALNQAMKLNPEDAEIHLYRARYFTERQKPDAAADQYQLALQLDKTNPFVLLETSKYYLLKGDTLGAEKLLREAINYDESCWECFRSLGIIADNQGDTVSALRYLRQYQKNIFRQDQEVEARLKRLGNIKN